jgi:hypothetical protein
MNALESLGKGVEGWLALGNFLGAHVELERISPTLRAHPEVLQRRCRICEAAKQWKMGLVVASTLSGQLPSMVSAWIHRPGCLSHLGRCDEAQSDAARVGERHHLKGEKEQLLSEVLNGLDLHRPPCWALRANQVYYLIAAVAYNLMIAIKLLDMSDDCQSWRVKRLMKKMVMLPGRLSQRSR